MVEARTDGNRESDQKLKRRNIVLAAVASLLLVAAVLFAFVPSGMSNQKLVSDAKAEIGKTLWQHRDEDWQFDYVSDASDTIQAACGTVSAKSEDNALGLPVRFIYSPTLKAAEIELPPTWTGGNGVIEEHRRLWDATWRQVCRDR